MATTRRRCSSAIRSRGTQNLSDETQTIVDEEIHRLVDEAYEHGARKSSTENIDELHTIARGLLEYETLSGDEIKDLLQGQAAGARVHRRADGKSGAGLSRSERGPRQEGAAGAGAGCRRDGASADIRLSKDLVTRMAGLVPAICLLASRGRRAAC